MQPTIDPLLSLILAALRWPDDDDRRSAINRAFPRSMDWDRLGRLMHRHRVGPLVAHGLESAGIALPEFLRNAQRQSTLAELGAVAQFERLRSLLGTHGIPVAILKGPAQSLRSFGRLGLRVNRDLDILIDPTLIDRAESSLVGGGYVRTEPSAAASGAARAQWLRNHKDMLFRHRDRHLVPVELHWRLFDNPAFLPDETAPFHTLGIAPLADCLVLPDDINLRYLCGHGALHCWSRLKWLADVNALLAGMPDELIASACRCPDGKPDHAVGQALALCTVLLGRPLPASVQLGPRAQWLARIAWNMISDSGTEELETLRFGSTRKNLSHYLLRENVAYWREELRFDLTVPPRDLPAGSRLGAWISRHWQP